MIEIIVKSRTVRTVRYINLGPSKEPMPQLATGPVAAFKTRKAKYRTSRDGFHHAGRMKGIVPGETIEVYKFNMDTLTGQYVTMPKRSRGKGSYSFGHKPKYKQHRRGAHDARFSHGAPLVS